jgi:hypothetical protein
VTRNAINTSEKSAIAITATSGQQPIEGGSRGGASSILTFWGSSSALLGADATLCADKDDCGAQPFADLAF